MRSIAPIINQYALGQPAGRVQILWLQAPDIARAARPGQFIMLKEPDSPNILGRPFSIAAVRDNALCVIYQQVGQVTARLPQLQAGHDLLLWGPLGHGFSFNQGNSLLIGGGVGLAPVLFAWQSLRTNAALLLGFDQWQRFSHLPRLLEQMGCPAQVKQIGANGKIEIGRVHVTSQQTSPQWQAECALALDPLNEENLKPFSGLYACGPWPMLKRLAAQAMAEEKPCQVAGEALMACGVGACQGCAVPRAGGGYVNLCQAGPVLSSLDLDWERL